MLKKKTYVNLSKTKKIQAITDKNSFNPPFPSNKKKKKKSHNNRYIRE